MLIAFKLMHQCRKPKGLFGRLNLWNMNHRHSKSTDWGLKHVSINKDATVLDIGCGGGRTIQKLAAIAQEGRVYGIDHSEESVAVSRRTNQQSIAAGRVEVRLGDVSHLDFPENMFDLVTAVETHFFWPDLPGDMKEVARVIKPGGKILVVAEAYKGSKTDKLLEKHGKTNSFSTLMGSNYTHLSVNENRLLLTNAGFSDVEV